ncbi:NRDE family protein [Carnobacterium jeotgali]|uniref:NRDE family protein n=1 Tax=Carnobacterium jeotgali TaxID=545534 RepID=UPI00388F37F8
MCLIVFKFQEHPIYKLILIVNRDESYSRPTATATFWINYPHILAQLQLNPYI